MLNRKAILKQLQMNGNIRTMPGMKPEFAGTKQEIYETQS
jgi:hypothetical protein